MLKPKRIKVNQARPLPAAYIQTSPQSAPLKALKSPRTLPAIPLACVGSLNEHTQKLASPAALARKESYDNQKASNDTPFSFISFLRAHPNSKEFIYLIPRRDSTKDALESNPYNLQIVPFALVNSKSAQGFYTMSAEGVTHFDMMGHGEFTQLDQWVREYELYNQLLKIPFFKRYRSWKCYNLWRKTILHTKIQAAKKSLANNLFILNPILRESVLAIRIASINISSKDRLIMIEDLRNYELTEFVKEQKKWIDTINITVLAEWATFCAENVTAAAKRCLKERGFDIQLLKDVEKSELAELKKLTFTEQAARRTECRKLQRYVKLTDYLIGNTLQKLVIESVQEMLKLSFRGCTDADVVIDPTGNGTVLLNDSGEIVKIDNYNTEMRTDDGQPAVIGVQVGGVVVGQEVSTELLTTCGFDGFSDILCRLIMAAVPKLDLVEIIEQDELATDMDDDLSTTTPLTKKKDDIQAKWKTDDSKKFVPLFRTELLVKDDATRRFYFSPSLQDYLGTIDILLKVYLSSAEGVPSLTNTIPFLDPAKLTGGAYSTSRGLEDLEFGEGLQLGSVIIDTAYFREICGRLRGVFVGMFTNASKWVESLEPLRNMWIENESFNALDSLKAEAGYFPYLLATATSESMEAGVAAFLLKVMAAEAPGAIKNTSDQDDLKMLEMSANFIEEDGKCISPLVKFFNVSLKKFAYQKQTMTAVPVRSVVNNILIDTTYLKSVLEPSPDRCFTGVAKLLPGISRDKNELLLTQVQSWVKILNSQPVNVEGFVEYLGWLEQGTLKF